jgi:cellulose biosynthesis protein BcsQ
MYRDTLSRVSKVLLQYLETSHDSLAQCLFDRDDLLPHPMAQRHQTDAERRPAWEQSRESAPVVINFIPKGGAAKTSTLVSLAAELVTQGEKVAIVDFDAQCNATQHYMDFTRSDGEDVLSQTDIEDLSADEEAEDPESRSAPERPFPKIPNTLKGYKLFTETDIFAGDTTHQVSYYEFLKSSKCHNVRSYHKTFLDEMGNSASPEIPILHSCNPDTYKGNLLLLPGHPRVLDIEKNMKIQDHPDSLYRTRTFAFFRTLFARITKEHKVTIIFVDVGPNVGLLNEVLVMSSDFVQPTSCADFYSFQSILNLLGGLRLNASQAEARSESTLLTWKHAWHKRLCSGPTRRLQVSNRWPEGVPRVLPILVVNFATDMVHKGAKQVWIHRSGRKYQLTNKLQVVWPACIIEPRDLPSRFRKPMDNEDLIQYYGDHTFAYITNGSTELYQHDRPVEYAKQAPLIKAVGTKKLFQAALKEKKTAEETLKKTDATPVQTREINFFAASFIGSLKNAIEKCAHKELEDLFVCEPSAMVTAFLPAIPKAMAVAHELGRAVPHITQKNIDEYHQFQSDALGEVHKGMVRPEIALAAEAYADLAKFYKQAVIDTCKHEKEPPHGAAAGRATTSKRSRTAREQGSTETGDSESSRRPLRARS